MARTETHFIWTDDYASRLDDIRRRMEVAQQDDTPLLGGEDDPLLALGVEYEALKGEAEAAGLRVILRGLRDDEWDELVDAHPPRRDADHSDSDKALGFNERTGARALVYAALVEPTFDTRTRFDDWVREKELTRGDLSAMAMRAWRLTNGAGFADPKSLPPLPTRNADEG